MSAKRWINDLFTGADNYTPDMARHGWAFANLTVLIAAVLQAVHNGAISLVELASALAITNGGGAAATMATKSSQPKPSETTNATVSNTHTGKTEVTTVETNTGGSASIDSPD